MRACRRFPFSVAATGWFSAAARSAARFFRGPTAGVAGLALFEAGVQRRLAEAEFRPIYQRWIALSIQEYDYSQQPYFEIR
jgi:hypothetical protein